MPYYKDIHANISPDTKNPSLDIRKDHCGLKVNAFCFQPNFLFYMRYMYMICKQVNWIHGRISSIKWTSFSGY